MTISLPATTPPHDGQIFAPEIVCNCSRVEPRRSVKGSHSVSAVGHFDATRERDSPRGIKTTNAVDWAALYDCGW